MNLTIISGNLTRDPELMETSNGTEYCNFTVAVNGETLSSNGEKQAYFYTCTAWKEKAKNIAKYCKKGSKVLIRGEMQTRSFTDKDGNNKTNWVLIVGAVEFLSKKQSDDSDNDISDNYSAHTSSRPPIVPSQEQLPF